MQATTKRRGTRVAAPCGAPTGFLSRNVQRGRQAGSSLVELAILAPALALLVIGAMDLSRVFHYGIVAANAARAGAQYGIVGNNTDTSGMSANAAEDANANCNDISPAPAGCSSGSLSNFGATTTGNQANCLCPTLAGAWVSVGTAPACTATPCPYDGSAPRVYVEVDTSYPFNPLFKVFGNSIGLNGKAIMRAEYAHPPAQP